MVNAAVAVGSFDYAYMQRCDAHPLPLALCQHVGELAPVMWLYRRLSWRHPAYSMTTKASPTKLVWGALLRHPHLECKPRDGLIEPLTLVTLENSFLRVGGTAIPMQVNNERMVDEVVKDDWLVQYEYMRVKSGPGVPWMQTMTRMLHAALDAAPGAAPSVMLQPVDCSGDMSRVPADTEALYRSVMGAANEALCLSVFSHERAGQVLLAAVFDNLGKGAAGAAVQNLDLMLGLRGPLTPSA